MSKEYVIQIFYTGYQAARCPGPTGQGPGLPCPGPSEKSSSSTPLARTHCAQRRPPGRRPGRSPSVAHPDIEVQPPFMEGEMQPEGEIHKSIAKRVVYDILLQYMS